MNKHYKIALVVKTDGLEYDDRIRKEILTIKKLYPCLDFEIFVMLQENKKYDGVTSYGIPFHAVYIQARDKYPSESHLLLKSYQFFTSIKDDLKSFDAVWCADIATFTVALLVKSNNLLWDLHELPDSLLGNPIKRMILKFLMRKSNVVVHANEERLNYLKKIKAVPYKSNQFVLRNYPNFDDVDGEYDELYSRFIDWLKGRKCVYLQGLDSDKRSSWESVRSVLQFPELCAVVVGDFDKEAKERLNKEFAESLEERVFFTGKVAQLKIPQYVNCCYFSLIFYKNTSPNNYYCEANRLYQSIILGLPVIVGFNPTMKSLVEQYKFGISIDDDGTDIKKITSAIEKMIIEHDHYIEFNKKYRDQLYWDSQDEIMREIVKKWIPNLEIKNIRKI